jgi:hypothetical protein
MVADVYKKWQAAGEIYDISHMMIAQMDFVILKG